MDIEPYMNPKEEQIEDCYLDEMLMITRVGNNYTEFKNCMEKYTRDMWY